MDEVLIADLVIISGILALLFLYWLHSSKWEEEKEDLFEQLEVLDRSLHVIGAFLQKIPEMQPQFAINQSPIGQLLEFFQSFKQNNDALGSPILDDTQVRDDSGRYSDGKIEEEKVE